MADQESVLLQQASVDYLNQINQNVVALNTTASAQRDLAERGAFTSQASMGVMDEARSGTMAAIQNQSYMAYGTFQHDMQGMAGFTDQATRTALATSQIAGGSMISDARDAYNSVSGVSMGAVQTFAELATPGRPGQTQGAFGSAAAVAGITAAPPSVYQKEYELESKGQLEDVPVQFKRYASDILLALERKETGGSAQAAAAEMGKVISDRAGYRFVEGYRSHETAGKVEGEPVHEFLGNSAYNAMIKLARSNASPEEQYSVVEMAQQAIYANPAMQGEKFKKNYEQEMTDFADRTLKIAQEFKVSLEEAAANLQAFSRNTSKSTAEAGDALLGFVKALQVSGNLAPNEALNALAASRETARSLGYTSYDQSFADYGDIYLRGRNRMATDAQFSEQVDIQGGLGAVSANMQSMQQNFMRTGQGLMYIAAGGAKGDIMNTMEAASGNLMDTEGVLKLMNQQAEGGPEAMRSAREGMIEMQNQAFEMLTGKTREEAPEAFKGLFAARTRLTGAALGTTEKDLFGEEMTGFDRKKINEEMKRGAGRFAAEDEKDRGLLARLNPVIKKYADEARSPTDTKLANANIEATKANTEVAQELIRILRDGAQQVKALSEEVKKK